MLELTDLKSNIEKETYQELFPKLTLEVRRLQWEARKANIPIVIVLSGWQAAGMDDAVAKFGDALDPRHIETHAIFDPSPEEQMYPFLWRFWNKTPRRGEIAIFDQSWYRSTINASIRPDELRESVRQRYRQINEFERQLTDDGALVLKYFLHISEREQKKRFKQFEKDEFEQWRITKEHWKRHERYDEYLGVIEEMLQETSTAEAPWHVVASNKRYYRRVKIFEIFIQEVGDAIERERIRRQERKLVPEKRTKQSRLLAKVPTILDRADLTLTLDDDEYENRLRAAQVRLRHNLNECYDHRIPIVTVFEGWDAAGKGGTIKRLLRSLDPRSYRVSAVAAPTDEELAHHYLWRFWRRLPKAGHLELFDRSWYGRLLVERVEGFCTEEEWKRAFREINEFEHELADFGTVLVKYWIHISKEEQLRRFKEREKNPLKQYKLTEEDWRNRKKWDLYKTAISDILERTSTTYGPWTIVENEHKYWGRVKVIETLNEAIKAELKRRDGDSGDKDKKKKKKD